VTVPTTPLSRFGARAPPTTYKTTYTTMSSSSSSSSSPKTLTKLSLGCSAFGGVFEPMPDDECLAIIRAAFAAGVTLLDTAPWYKASEEVVGRCLRRVSTEAPRESYQLNTKCGRYPTGQMFDFSAARVAASVETSLQRLQVDYIDTMQVHDCEFGDEDVVVNETLPLLDALRRQGKVRKIGITGYDLDVLRRIIQRSSVKIDSVLSYCRYAMYDRSLVEQTWDAEEDGETTTPATPSSPATNAASATNTATTNRRQEDFLTFLSRRGIAFIGASPIGMGLLCNQPAPDWHPASAELKQRCRAASDYAEARGSNLARLAVAFCVREPRVPTTLVSCTSLALMNANLDVMHNGLTPDEEALLEDVVARFFPRSEHWVGVEKRRVEEKAARKRAEAAEAANKLKALAEEEEEKQAAEAAAATAAAKQQQQTEEREEKHEEEKEAKGERKYQGTSRKNVNKKQQQQPAGRGGAEAKVGGWRPAVATTPVAVAATKKTTSPEAKGARNFWRRTAASTVR
jgi:L-galactose dehydrogenase